MGIIDISTGEISRYKKRKESSTSKAKVKSNHKHDYQRCLIDTRIPGVQHDSILVANVCGICGKVKLSQVFVLEDGILLSSYDVLQKFPELPIYKLRYFTDRHLDLPIIPEDRINTLIKYNE